MRKMKKFLSVVVASAMVLAMAGCGSGDSGKGSNSASGDGVFKIGGMGPLTGDYSAYGKGVANAAQIAVDEINDAGGVTVNGKSYTLELNFQDDECDAEKAVTAYNTVKDWGAQVILGAVTSGASIAVSAETAKDNMFQLTPSGSAVECTGPDNSFRVCFSDPNQGAASAQYIGENNLATKVAVIYESSSVYSSGIYESFKKGSANQSFEIVSEGAFTSDSKTDFSAQLQDAKDKGADLVFLPIYYSESALILAQAKQIGYAPKFFSCDGMDGILTVENFDTSLAEGVMLLTPFAADAYDGIYAIKAAIEKSGVTPDKSISEICDALKTGITSISLDGLTGEGMTWDASGEPDKAPKAVVIKNGAYKAM